MGLVNGIDISKTDSMNPLDPNSKMYDPALALGLTVPSSDTSSSTNTTSATVDDTPSAADIAKADALKAEILSGEQKRLRGFARAHGHHGHHSIPDISSVTPPPSGTV